MYKTKNLQIKILLGYLFIALIVCSICYIYNEEGRELDVLETANRRMNAFRQEVHHAYAQTIELSPLGETALEWEDKDMQTYHRKRLEVDSLLCRFKTIYPTGRIDSVRHLLESKEQHLLQIMQVLDEQKAINDRIAERVPVIAWKSTQEEPKKAKRKGLFGLFGKKEKPEPTATTTMLYTLNRNVITRQRAQSRCLSEHADSLAARNISWIAVGKSSIDLKRAMEILRAEFGIERLSVTGGGNINAAFLKEGLLDEVSMMWCPGIDGRYGMTAAFDGLTKDFPPTKLRLMSVEKLGETIWARYKL